MPGGRPPSFVGRKVKFSNLISTHDAKAFVSRDHEGVVLETHWRDGICQTLVAVKDGTIYLLPATKLTLVNPPLETPDKKYTL